MQEDYDVYYDRDLFRKLLGVGCLGVPLRLIFALLLSSALMSESVGFMMLVFALSIVAQCLLFDAFKLIRFPLLHSFKDRSRGIVFGDSEKRCYVVFGVVLLNYLAAVFWVSYVSTVLTAISPLIIAVGLSSGACILSLFALKRFFPITDSIFNLIVILAVGIMLF